MSQIKFFITGGTIDKVYNELDGALTFSETNILTMLRQARSQIDLSPEVLMLKDSLEMNDNDREEISAKCHSCEESRIIISHGTDTMVDTASVLAKKIVGKTIVLFGAMIPYTISNSDSQFNLGCAVTAVQCMDEGVYITMNGQVFPWDDVKKNKTEGIFQAKTFP